MDNLQLYKQQIKELEKLVNKLDNGELEIEELVQLETLTRELHEKSIILKYKAFEEKTSVSAQIESKTPEVVQEEIEEDSPAIDFSIFEKEDSEPEKEEIIIAEKPIPEPEPEIESEPVVETEETEEIIEKTPEVNSDQEVSNDSGSSFMDRFSEKDNSLNTQFGDAKIDSLIGAFGLNQKLRYINELFDGSSDMFSEAIKLLDAQSSMDDAKPKVEELAAQNSWDPEDESVIEFMIILNRRYA